MLKVITEKAVSSTVSLLKKAITHIVKNASALWSVETVGDGKVLRFNHKLACTVDAGNDGHSNSHYQAWLYKLPRVDGKVDSETLENMLFECIDCGWPAMEAVCRHDGVSLPRNLNPRCIEQQWPTVTHFVQGLPEKYDEKAMEKHGDRIVQELNALLQSDSITDEQEMHLFKLSRVPDEEWFSAHWCMLPDDLKKVSVIQQSDFFTVK